MCFYHPSFANLFSKFLVRISFFALLEVSIIEENYFNVTGLFVTTIFNFPRDLDHREKHEDSSRRVILSWHDVLFWLPNHRIVCPSAHRVIAVNEHTFLFRGHKELNSRNIFLGHKGPFMA